MPTSVTRLLASPGANVAARLLVTAAFWISGISKLVFWQSGVGTMAHFGLHPPVVFNIATIIVQLAGSALIIWGRRAWLGAVLLAVFTALTIPIAQHFWDMQGPARAAALNGLFEHISLIGGLLAIAIVRSAQPGTTN